MSSLSIQLKNQAKIVKAFRDSPKEMAKAIQNTLEQVGGEAVGKVKVNIASGTDMWKAPLDTGAMMRGISVTEKTPLKVVISPDMNTTPYAKYVHDGTGKMRARPFLEITKNRDGKYLEGFFQRTLDKFVDDLAKKIG